MNLSNAIRDDQDRALSSYAPRTRTPLWVELLALLLLVGALFAAYDNSRRDSWKSGEAALKEETK